MIPAFDSAGNLPEGVHDATIADVVARFGGTSQRDAVLADLLRWLAHMQAAGCRTVYLNGSFVTAKADPGDFDACYDSRGIDLSKLDPDISLRTAETIQRTKARWGGDIRSDFEYVPGSIRSYLRFFMFDSRTNRNKGILRIALETWTP